MPSLSEIRAEGLQAWFKARTGMEILNAVTLRTQQEDTLDWCFSRPEPYLFINAPTGTGKTLLNLAFAAAHRDPWTYTVHTISLQKQVAATVSGLPTLIGRDHFACLIGHELYGKDVTARYGKCTWDEDCEVIDDCGYYTQLRASTDASSYRVTNYAMFLAMQELRSGGLSRTLVADEAHNIESVITSAREIVISSNLLHILRIQWPDNPASHVAPWRGWALDIVKRIHRRTRSLPLRDLRNAALALRAIKREDYENWNVQFDGRVVRFRPLWGAPYVLPSLLGHRLPEGNTSLLEATDQKYQPDVRRALFTSATLMGAEHIARTLGLPDGSWAYLDLPSVFPANQRPVNYAPIQTNGREATDDGARRANMQRAIDRLIEHYIMQQHPWGIIHAVSNNYRDAILTESRWRGIMTPDQAVHSERVSAGRASVLVAANITEGYDGYDNLCRFIILPKVPYPDLSDGWTRRRMAADARTYDHSALVAVVQGVGRGMRHALDYCDSWILDANWAPLFKRHYDWLPQSFLDSYHSNVLLPKGLSN